MKLEKFVTCILIFAVILTVVALGFLFGDFISTVFAGGDGAMISHWTMIGSIGSNSVYWTKNPENGDRVYIMVGKGRGGIFVIPKEQP